MSAAPWLSRASAQLEALLAATGAPVLVHGHQPRGLFDLVQSHVAKLLCEAPAASKPCEQCAACQMRAAGNHPDLRLLLPQAKALDMGLPVELKSGTKPSGDIRIDDVRNLQNYFNTSSSRGGARFVLVYPFDAMNTNTANALLKTLEEPPKGLRFVFVGSRLDQLLPTIRSRCQLLTVPVPSPQECQAWLAAQGVQQAELALSLALQDPFEALELDRNGQEDLALRKKMAEWLANPDQHGQPPVGVEKVGLPVAMELSLRLLADCVHIAQGSKPVQFPWLAPKLLWAKAVDVQKFSKLYQGLLGESRLANHPINPRLALEYLGQQWQTLCQ
ncbi:hypothetical protein [Limnobacter sp.]|uniref:hypothetical protein n=1 Tax=Limnobacter sp. TaxID=2003368 RepID=UPI0035153062